MRPSGKTRAVSLITTAPRSIASWCRLVSRRRGRQMPSTYPARDLSRPGDSDGYRTRA